MKDGQGRTIRYLRLSLTPRCPMRCLYCRPAVDGATGPSPHLSVDEIVALVGHLVKVHGLAKVRLTGGEPTSRADLLDIVAGLAGLSEVAMTTNGLTLERQADALARAGLARVNVSLDSLDRHRFAAMTGVDGLPRVLAGIAAAQAAGLEPVRLNAVVVRGQNDAELPDLVRFAADRGLEIRFIELMPMGPLAGQWAGRFVSQEQMRRTLDGEVEHWLPLPQGPGSARRYQARLHDGREVMVGFIAAMSCPFCSLCDRIRVGADGTLYPCLMDRPAGSLLEALRPRFDPRRLDTLLAAALSGKAAEHPAAGPGVMTRIGG